MTLTELEDTFALLDNWEERYQLIIDLGRQLEPLPDDAYTDANKVRGCMSQVWMVATADDDTPPHIHILADSDAHIVKGLIAILLIVFSGRPADEIAALDVEPIFERLGLIQHISVNRRNGFYAMIQRIRDFASEVA